MARILIDTNIFLEFFKTSDPSLLKHASVLSAQGVREDLFIPQQLVDEIERNKLAVASRFLGDQLKKIALPRVSLPGFPDGIRKKLTTAADAAQTLRNEGLQHAKAYLKQLASGSDAASLALAPIIESPVAPDEEALRRARDRRERGNPPGKPGDPLGDQIIWEQFLAQVKKGPIWVISKDSDYIVEFERVRSLNAFLARELRARVPGADVRAFDSLAEGLRDFLSETEKESKEAVAAALLTAAESEQARQVERLLDEADDEDDRTLCELCDPGEDRGPALVDWTYQTEPPSPERPSSLFDQGTCNWCNGLSIRCRTCGAITAVSEGQYDEALECEGGCGFKFEVEDHHDRKGVSWTEVKVLEAAPP